ncbi:MAG TPA: hypothetical protein VG148_06930 [Pyrinomonadaceae bacterium]|nr:hypothetical protein [Pyrinomonadaceae bacterium]
MSFERNSTRPAPPRSPAAARALVFAALLACACAEAAGQSPTPSPRPAREDAAPPPMRYLPEETREKLKAEARDLKDRTKLSIELAEARLASAAAYAAADRFEAATLELGVYEAIVKDAIAFLKATGKNSNKIRDLFKRVEIALRSHVPRLETLRRGLPSQHAVHAQATLDFVRDARTEALEAFFDDTIIPERPAPKANAPGGERAKGVAPDNGKKPDRR